MSIEPTIKCSNIQLSLEFYTKVLDFEVCVAPDPEPGSFMSKYALIERQGDNVHLSEHEGDGVFGNVIYVRVDNVESLLNTFEQQGLVTDPNEGYPALSIPLTEQTWGMKEFSIRDPDGNKMTFGEPL